MSNPNIPANKRNLTVECNQFGNAVRLRSNLTSATSLCTDFAMRRLVVENLALKHGEHLVKRLVSEALKDGLKVVELDQGNSAGSIIMELAGNNKEVVILYRPTRGRLSYYRYYVESEA
ncbi:hypothetical protein VpasPP24_11 [Vibrio phage Vpas_PP24]|nr:hypothetical protein VpasPP24_11 [Vibrio phage Vpas_PP24]